MAIAPILKGAWTVFWVTSLYSYASCGVVGVVTGIKTKGDHAAIDKQVDAFIISPLYVATFFSLFSLLFFWRGTAVMHAAPQGLGAWYMIGLGLAVFIGHTILELLEATIIRHDPLRMLNDRDAMRLSAIYLVIIVLATVTGILSF